MQLKLMIYNLYDTNVQNRVINFYSDRHKKGFGVTVTFHGNKVRMFERKVVTEGKLNCTTLHYTEYSQHLLALNRA